MSSHFAESHFADSHFAESHFAESHFAESHFAESHFTESHFAESHFAESHFAESRLYIVAHVADGFIRSYQPSNLRFIKNVYVMTMDDDGGCIPCLRLCHEY